MLKRMQMVGLACEIREMELNSLGNVERTTSARDDAICDGGSLVGARQSAQRSTGGARHKPVSHIIRRLTSSTRHFKIRRFQFTSAQHFRGYRERRLLARRKHGCRSLLAQRAAPRKCAHILLRAAKANTINWRLVFESHGERQTIWRGAASPNIKWRLVLSFAGLARSCR